MSPYNILDRLVSQWLPSLTQVLLQERCWCQTCCSLFENKLSHFINTKDKIPFFNKPSVVFEFSYPRCRAKYISKLTVYYEITSKSVYDKDSTIYQHLQMCHSSNILKEYSILPMTSFQVHLIFHKSGTRLKLLISSITGTLCCLRRH